MLTNGEIALGNAMIVAAITFWAILMALYFFVFNYFLAKSEQARFQSGERYRRFFFRVMLSSGEMLWIVVTGAVALLSDSELVLVISFAGFVTFIPIGAYAIIKEVWTTHEFVLPYASVRIFADILTKSYLRAIRKNAKQLTSKEAADEYVRRAIESAFADAAKKTSKDKEGTSDKTEKGPPPI